MNKLLLLAFLVTLLALAAAGSQEEEEEEGALTRLAREADPGRPRRIKCKKGDRKCGKPRPDNIGDRKKSRVRQSGIRREGRKAKAARTNACMKICNKSGKESRNRCKKCKRRRNRGEKTEGRRGSRKSSTKVSGKCGRGGRAVNSTSTCLINAMTYLNLTRLQITNYLKQIKRMKSANSTGDKKSGKKGIFATTAQRMIKAGGGNKSALACNGNTNTSGAAQMTNVTNTLMGCEAKIKAACDTSSFPLPNMTVVAACESAMTTFVGMVTFCMGGRNETAACSCWDNSNFTLLANTTIRNCSISSENKLVTAQLKYCKGNFSACKQMEDDGMMAMSSCSQSTASLLADAAALTANSAGLAAAQNTTSSLTGNSTSNSTGRHRQTRAVVTTCAAVISTIAKILVIVDQSTTSTQISTLAATVTGVSVTCTTTEKTSLTTQATSLAAAKTSVDGNLATVQADLLTATGSTASSASISAAASATAASSARRNIVARHLLNRLNLN